MRSIVLIINPRKVILTQTGDSSHLACFRHTQNISMHILMPCTLWLERLPARHKSFPIVVKVGLSERLLRESAWGLLLGRECIGQWLHLGTSASDDLTAFDLKQSAAGDLCDVLAVLFAIFLILLVDVQQQFLELVASQ